MAKKKKRVDPARTSFKKRYPSGESNKRDNGGTPATLAELFNDGFLKVPVADWNTFTTVVTSLENDDPCKTRFCFRGQADEAWPLRPAFDRFFVNGDVVPNKVTAIEDAALIEFQAKAHQYADLRDLENTESFLEWWTLMQHFGAPTRLLDWTESAYVAAYFAVAQLPDKDGAVWFVEPNTLRILTEEKLGARPEDINHYTHADFCNSKSPRVVDFFYKTNRSARMIAQQGLFSVCRTPLVDHDSVIHEHLSPVSKANGYLPNAKIIIPAREKRIFLRRLRSMNITASSLFPGLDGLGRSVSELVTLASRPIQKNTSAR